MKLPLLIALLLVLMIVMVSSTIIIIEEGDVVTDSLLVNITAESGDANFTHLNISTTAPYDDLVGYWSFDGDAEDTFTTTHYDFTESGNDGIGASQANATSTGCLTNFGNCLQLDGGGDYIEVGDIDLTGNLTISVWVLWNDVSWGVDPDGDAIISKGYDGSNLPLRLSGGDGNLEFGFFDGDWDNRVQYAEANFQTGVWYHLVGTINGTDLVLYVNSVNVASLESLDTPSPNNYNLLIGAYNKQTVIQNYHDGIIDEVMIFNTSLTPAQILEIYNNQSARFVMKGTQQLNNQTYLNITSGNNRVNITTSYENNLNSNISLLLGYYDGSWSYTQPQNITGLNEYTISSTATNLTLNFTFYAGNSSHPFYTPILKGDITLETWSVGDTTPPIVTLISPANNSYWDIDLTPDFNFSAYDDVGITNCTLYINNTFNKSQTTNANFTNNPMTNGTYEWFANCSDSTPNWGYSGAFNLVINYTTIAPPALNIIKLNYTDVLHDYAPPDQICFIFTTGEKCIDVDGWVE